MGRKHRDHGFSLTREYGGVPVWGIAGALVLAGLFVVVPMLAAATAPAATPYVRPTDSDVFDYSTPAVEVVDAVWLGDSYIEASQVEDGEGFADIVSEHFGWRVDNRGQGGTGYLNPGPEQFPERGPLPERVADIVAAAPEVVVVAAGLNDQQLIADDGTALRDAVRATLTPLREGLPDATIYVVGPFWPTGYPNDAILVVRDVVQQTAADLGLTFIDPIAGQWITGTRDGSEPGNRAEFILEDGTHPNVAGQAWIAEQLIASLTAVGVVPA